MGREYPYIFNVGDIISNLKLTKRTYIERVDASSKNKTRLVKGYEYICCKCGYLGSKNESDLKRGIGCPACRGLVVEKDINSIWKTNNKVAMIFKNEGDMYSHTEFSHKKVETKCPICGYEDFLKVSDMSVDGYRCKRCSDNVSMPNKFIHSLLDMANINFNSEKLFEWSNGKVYDFYIPDIDCIIEAHGRQHYEENGFKSCGGKSLKMEVENDKIKNDLAISNGIKKYITVDCRLSTLEFLTSSVLNSDICDVIDIDMIDFKKCYEYACVSNVLKVREMWDDGIKGSYEISKILKTSQQTAIKYMKQCRDIGWIDYDEVDAAKKGRANGHSKMSRKIVCLNNGYETNSINEMIEKFKQEHDIQMTNSGIVTSCAGRTKHHKGYTFKYVE